MRAEWSGMKERLERRRPASIASSRPANNSMIWDAIDGLSVSTFNSQSTTSSKSRSSAGSQGSRSSGVSSGRSVSSAGSPAHEVTSSEGRLRQIEAWHARRAAEAKDGDGPSRAPFVRRVIAI